MSLFVETATDESTNTNQEVANTVTQNESRELTIHHLESEHVQESAMPEEMRMAKSKDANLAYLLNEVLESKGELSEVKKEWIGKNEVKMEGMSNMTLHSFILKAEELGKKITYTRTLKVTITD